MREFCQIRFLNCSGLAGVVKNMDLSSCICAAATAEVTSFTPIVFASKQFVEELLGQSMPAGIAARKESRIARTVVLKLKTSDFKILTRSHTPLSPPSSCEELTDIALLLRGRVGLDAGQHFRLVGVGLTNFRDPGDTVSQAVLFA